MQGLILQEANNIRKNIPKLSKLNDEYVFSLVCYKYFYNKGLLNHSDYVDIFVDGQGDGGLDLVQVIEDSNDQLTLLLIQSKDFESLANSNDIIDILNKMHSTLKNFQEGRTAQYSKKLKQKLKDKLAEVEGQAPIIDMVIFHNAEISTERMQKIKEQIENIDYLSAYQVYIFDRKDIEQQIKSILEPQRFVPEGKINIAKEDGHINFEENGLLVNMYASSLRDLYDRYRDRGLFEQNFRYFVKNKRIDDNIRASLSRKRDKFWFLNNGIIIGCYNFRFDHSNVKLEKFSIINGCQTATLIGEYKGHNQDEDFVLPCKIVRSKEGSSEEEFFSFISEIAESSNSQKPISDRDLKSNRPEQRKLQALLKEDEPKIYLEIKRGEQRKRNLEQWQTVVNDDYAQLVLSFNFQQPGTARSRKRKIFADEQIYNKIFKRAADKDNIVDVLRLNQFYKEFLEKKFSEDGFTNADQENVATNGRLVILSIVGFLIRAKRNLIDLKLIQNENEWDSELQKDTLKGSFFAELLPDDYLETLYSLFLEIIQELAYVYDMGEERRYKTVSNFFKRDDYYSFDILRYIKNKFIDIPARKKIIDNYLSIFR